MQSFNSQASVHAHDVLDLIRETHLSTAALLEEAGRRFGAGATYHTCSRQGLALPQLLEMFLSKNKLIFEDGRLVVNENKPCGSRD